ncbi:MAG: hypothetical protein V1778_01445, partial [bacterium]
MDRNSDDPAVGRAQRRLSDYQKYRILEMLPGVLVWGTFGVAILLSFLRPLWAVYFIVVFDLYWLVRVVYLLLYLVIGYRRYRQAILVDWFARVKERPDWQRIRHLIFLPRYAEPLQLLRESLLALERSTFPTENIIIVLALEERGPQYREFGKALQEEFAHRFGHFLITYHPDGIAGELAGKGANIAWAGREVKKYLDTNLRIP